MDMFLEDKVIDLKRKYKELSQENEDNEVAITENYEQTLKSESSITDIELAIVDLYELILGGANNG